MLRFRAIIRYIYSILKSFYDYVFCSDQELEEDFFQEYESKSKPLPSGFGSNSSASIDAPAIDENSFTEIEAELGESVKNQHYMQLFMNDLIHVCADEKQQEHKVEKYEVAQEQEVEKPKSMFCKSYFENYYYVIAYNKILQNERNEMNKIISRCSSALCDDQKAEVPEINMSFVSEQYEELKATYFMNFSSSPLTSLLEAILPSSEPKLDPVPLQLQNLNEAQVLNLAKH